MIQGSKGHKGKMEMGKPMAMGHNYNNNSRIKGIMDSSTGK